MDVFSEGCYCIQAQTCQHWIASSMDQRLAAARLHSHERTAAFEQERVQGDHRPIVNELQRELRVAMLEIEKLVKMSRDLARVNQEVEEARLLAVSDQARTAKRLLLMSSQLEYTEQKLYSLTQEMDDGQKDSDLLRIERIKREALQEREDASRLKIEALQDELQEVQRSERSLQQKLTTTQAKLEAVGKRHDHLRRQQQELELARESKEALAWLKETTDRLCSPPQGSLGQAIQQERSFQGSAPMTIAPDSPSSSPPYPSSIMDPPLAAQNQLISLIKELATTNSTLRSELNEYRDLLQDARNEVLILRSQVEDYEQGHAFEGCCGSSLDPALDGLRTLNGPWETLDASLASLGGMGDSREDDIKDPLSGLPPPYRSGGAEHHLHQHFHLPGIRGNVFGELERLYSQGSKVNPPSLKGKSHSSKKSLQGRRASKDHERVAHARSIPIPADLLATTTTMATVSTSTSTSEVRRNLAPLSTAKRPGHLHSHSARSHSHTPTFKERSSKLARAKSRKSLYTDADMDMLDSESEDEQAQSQETTEDVDPGELFSDSADSGSDQEPGFVAAFAEALSFLSFFSGPMSGSPP